jgi:hypothetical protein
MKYRDSFNCVQDVLADLAFRRRAAAVAKVISRIELSFEPTGRKHPTTRMTHIRFVPVGDEDDPHAKNAGLSKCPKDNSFCRDGSSLFQIPNDKNIKNILSVGGSSSADQQ